MIECKLGMWKWKIWFPTVQLKKKRGYIRRLDFYLKPFEKYCEQISLNLITTESKINVPICAQKTGKTK